MHPLGAPFCQTAPHGVHFAIPALFYLRNAAALCNPGFRQRSSKILRWLVWGGRFWLSESGTCGEAVLSAIFIEANSAIDRNAIGEQYHTWQNLHIQLHCEERCILHLHTSNERIPACSHMIMSPQSITFPCEQKNAILAW